MPGTHCDELVQVVGFQHEQFLSPGHCLSPPFGDGGVSRHFCAAAQSESSVQMGVGVGVGGGGEPLGVTVEMGVGDGLGVGVGTGVQLWAFHHSSPTPRVFGGTQTWALVATFFSVWHL